MESTDFIVFCNVLSESMNDLDAEPKIDLSAFNLSKPEINAARELIDHYSSMMFDYSDALSDANQYERTRRAL